jgi:hypothetical protein
MAEATAPESTTPPATPEAPAASPLEEVYKTYNIEEQAAQFQPQSTPPAQPATPAPKVPDPFDPNFPKYQEAVSRSVVDTQSALHELKGQFSNLQRSLQQQRVEADIKSAVSVITEEAKIDPVIAEVALEAKARQDPRFLKIWEGRAKNPAAFNAAVKAFAKECQERYTVRQDPQLVENQRAAKVSQQQMATTQGKSENDKWLDMSPADRQREVQRLLRLGGR